MEESVGQWAADTLVKEGEHQSNPDAFLGEQVGVSGSVTREQGMGLELVQVITELGPGFGAELEGGEQGLVDLAGAPSAQLGAAVEQDFHKTEHAGVLDLDAGDFGVTRGDGKSQTLEQREIDVNIRAWASNWAKRSVTPARVRRTVSRLSNDFFRPKSFRLLLRTSKRRKVEHFSYMRSTAFLAQARSP
jgi:hypothetical protein